MMPLRRQPSTMIVTKRTKEPERIVREALAAGKRVVARGANGVLFPLAAFEVEDHGVGGLIFHATPRRGGSFQVRAVMISDPVPDL